MEPKSHFLGFYENKCRELKDLEFLGPGFQNNPRIKKRLQQAKKFPALKKLCCEDEETMFVALQTFLLLPLAKRIENWNLVQNRKAKNLPASTKRYMKTLIKKCVNNIDRVSFIDPDIDKNKFMETAEKWVNYKVGMKILGLDELDDGIDFVCMVDPKLDRNSLKKNLNKPTITDSGKRKINQVCKHFGIKEKYHIDSEGFNESLIMIFNLCKHKTGQSDNSIHNLMAEVLNSLKITTTTGKPFTGANVKSTISRLSK